MQRQNVVRLLLLTLMIALPARQALAGSRASMLEKLKHLDMLMIEDGIFGIASTYNPFAAPGEPEGFETASGQSYDPDTWTAAIRTDLRQQFGGVRFGDNYRPRYALVECGDRKVIVRINDVGPLAPGRIIDLNDRTMRYFDPGFQRGLIQDVVVTPLPGEYWIAGPLTDEPLVATAELPAGKAIVARFDAIGRLPARP